MAWHTGMHETRLEDIRVALSTLAHHQFFEAYGEGLKEHMIGEVTSTDESNLAAVIRRYVAQQELIQELSQVAVNEASHLAVIPGEDDDV